MPRLGYTDAVLARYCKSCGARPEALCMTMSGNVAAHPHPVRTREKVPTRKKPHTIPPGTRLALIRRAGGWCETCPLLDSAAPRHEGSEVHHRLRRSQGGTDDLDNLLWSCRRGHHLVHMDPARSYRAGALVRASAP